MDTEEYSWKAVKETLKAFHLGRADSLFCRSSLKFHPHLCPSVFICG